jgi:hypothetical protein
MRTAMVVTRARAHTYKNRHALAALGNPDAVTLMCERHHQIIGSLPSDRRRRHSFPLRRKQGEASRCRMLHASNFCNLPQRS